MTKSKQRFHKQYEDLLSASDQFAIQLSEWAGAGDWRLFFLHRDRMEKVTAADVNRVAQEYLTAEQPNGRASTTRRKQAERAQRPAGPGRRPSVVEGLQGPGDRRRRARRSTRPRRTSRSGSTRGTVGAGIKTAFLPKKTRGETANLELNLRFGNEESLKGRPPRPSSSPRCSLRGTKTTTRQQLQDELDKLGAQVSFGRPAPGCWPSRVKVKQANLAATLTPGRRDAPRAGLPGGRVRHPQAARSSSSWPARKTDPAALAIIRLQRKLSTYPPEDVRYVPTVDEEIERRRPARSTR